MASSITPTQTRINDPYQNNIFSFNTVDSKVYLSRESNQVLNAIGNDIVLKGLTVASPTINLAQTTISTVVATGMAIQDSTILEYTASATVDINVSALDDTTHNGAKLAVFSNYEYLITGDQNLASIEIYHVNSAGVPTSASFDIDRCSILLGIIEFTKDAGTGLITAATLSSATTLVILGNTLYVHGLDPANIILPNMFEATYRDTREYLLKLDYLMSE